MFLFVFIIDDLRWVNLHSHISIESVDDINVHLLDHWYIFGTYSDFYPIEYLEEDLYSRKDFSGSDQRPAGRARRVQDF